MSKSFFTIGVKSCLFKYLNTIKTYIARHICVRMKRIICLCVLLFSLVKSNGQIKDSLISTLATTNEASIEQVTQRLSNIQQLIQSSSPPILLFSTNEDTLQQAQQLAITDTSFTKYVVNKKLHQKTLSEIFGIYPPIKSNQSGEIFNPYLYRVEMYNYAHNCSSVAFVDVLLKKVISVNHYFQTQPDVPKYLGDLALQIAASSATIKQALGYSPSLSKGEMYYTYTALNNSRCERSRHLCIAPTFVTGNKALWAIVDLTELKLVGIRWTNLGRDSIPTDIATERKIQNEFITDCFCKKENSITQDGWKMQYSLTASDGLRVANVSYNNEPVLSSAKLVDWHVNYSNTDGFGYSDAVGCPSFSHGAVIAIEAPTISKLLVNNIEEGFVLEQKFYSKGWPRPCNYNYVQRFEFYKDGSFRVAAGSLGRGCGNNGTYRPVMRIAFANTSNNFIENNTLKPVQWNVEKYKQINKDTRFIITSSTTMKGYIMYPDLGQFSSNNINDNPFVYVTKNKPDADEGETDLVTIGPCCNTDYRQGPEKFIEPKPDNIENSPLVIWYVPTLKNNDTPGKEYCWAKASLQNGVYTTTTYPCIAGPKFVPQKNKQ